MKVLDILSTVGALVMATAPLAVAGVARAEPAAPVAIQVGDLDFGARTDIARFDARVVKAADALCGDTRELSRRSACISAVREEAVAKLGSEQRSRMIASTRRTSAWNVASAQ